MRDGSVAEIEFEGAPAPIIIRRNKFLLDDGLKVILAKEKLVLNYEGATYKI